MEPEPNILSGKSILVVDDNKINQFLANKVLSGWGVNVDFAENGQIAVHKVVNNNYDIVLMDLHMPILNGYDAAREIRSFNNGQFQQSPIILALTASIVAGDTHEVAESGMNGYILKPFVINDLRVILSTFLREPLNM